jgi:hypothetical protein
MEFEWESAKARANERKHGVSFLDALELFGDDNSRTVRDPDHSFDEDRYLLFGTSSAGKRLVVSYTERGNRIRLISARRMTRGEQSAYEE